MKTIRKYFSLLMMLPFLALTNCGREEIVFDYENEHFDTQDGKILLEVVVPTSTQATDELYILGEFNGGMAALGNDAYKLSIHPNTTAKWGVYLDANTDLSKGYWFYSKAQREERALNGDSIVRYDNFTTGSRNLLTIARWAAYFDAAQGGDDEIEHDGYVLYVLNESSETDLALYAWGDADAFGAWPGKLADGTQQKNGVTYTYFDLGEANTGLNLHLIPNNNNGGVQWEGEDLYFTIDHDIYIRIWDGDKTSYEVLGTPEPTVEHDGYAVFLFNASKETDFALYAWIADSPEPFGGWPGMSPTGKQTINGNEYIYFDMTEANNGLTLNLIPNNNNGGVQWEGSGLAITIDHDVYIRLNEPASAGDKTAYEVLDGPYKEKVTVVPPEPKEPKETKEYKFYFKDETGWDAVAVYAYGAKELFGAWPGTTFSDKETVGEVEYYVIKVESEVDANYSLIINNTLADDDKIQYDATSIVLNKDYFFTVTATSCTEITE